MSMPTFKNSLVLYNSECTSNNGRTLLWIYRIVHQSRRNL